MLKSKVLLALFLLFAARAEAQVALAQACVSTSGSLYPGGSLSETINLGSAATVGNHIVIYTSWSTSRTASVSDTGSNTYTESFLETAIGGAGGIFWQAIAPVTTTTSAITVTLSGSSSGSDILIACEVDNLVSPYTALDDSSTNTSAASFSHDSGNVTTTVANTFLIGGIHCGAGTYTMDADFTQIINTAWGAIGYDILTATEAAYSLTITSAQTETCGILLTAYQGTGAASGGKGRRNLLGVGD